MAPPMLTNCPLPTFTVSARRNAIWHMAAKKYSHTGRMAMGVAVSVSTEVSRNSFLLILGVLHRLLAFCDAQRRGGFERGAQRSASVGRIVFGSDNVAPQSGQRGEQLFPLRIPDIEFI